MRYHIKFDKAINQLIPHYLGGRKLILLLQSTLYPLQRISDEFSEWANETRIELSMTSQVFKLEWFLNRKFSKYYENESENITIKSTAHLGVPFYSQDNKGTSVTHPVLYGEDENQKTTVLYNSNERNKLVESSFLVYSPKVNTKLISEEEYESMLKYQIDKYRLSGKTYEIVYDNETL